MQYTKNTKVGDRFNRFTVEEILPWGKAIVRCDCGVTRKVQISYLHTGRRQGCGCDTFYKVGEVLNGRRIIERSTKKRATMLVECVACGHLANLTTHYILKCVCRNCKYIQPKMENGRVYALTCPLTGEVRYVGATKHSLKKRLRGHRDDCSNKKKKHRPFFQWLLQLIDDGSWCGAIMLEEVHAGDLGERELFWTRKLSKEGVRLLNIDHNFNLKQEAEHAA